MIGRPMPIHVAITRRVRPGCEAEFQKALREFLQTSFAHGGVQMEFWLVKQNNAARSH